MSDVVLGLGGRFEVGFLDGYCTACELKCMVGLVDHTCVSSVRM